VLDVPRQSAWAGDAHQEVAEAIVRSLGMRKHPHGRMVLTDWRWRPCLPGERRYWMRSAGCDKIQQRFGPKGYSNMRQGHACPIRRVAVRWPFRVLAALICAAGVVAVGGIAYAVFFDSRFLGTERVLWAARLLLMLPGTLWLMRLAGHAAPYRYSSEQSDQRHYWPFATGGVLFAYVVLMWFVWHAMPS